MKNLKKIIYVFLAIMRKVIFQYLMIQKIKAHILIVTKILKDIIYLMIHFILVIHFVKNVIHLEMMKITNALNAKILMNLKQI